MVANFGLDLDLAPTGSRIAGDARAGMIEPAKPWQDRRSEVRGPLERAMDPRLVIAGQEARVIARSLDAAGPQHGPDALGRSRT